MNIFIKVGLLLAGVLCFVQKGVGSYADLMSQKRQLLLWQIADHYTPPSIQIGDPQKYYWPKAMARMELYGVNDSLANAYIDHLAMLPPFHFTLVGMARMVMLYPEAPALKKHYKIILQNVLQRTDHYNAFTSEGTENHISMSRTSGYLYAQQAIKAKVMTEVATLKLNEMKLWLMQWSKRLYEKGNGEWNSSIYGVYNMIGWLNLLDFADDPEVRLAARAVVDYYALEFAMFYSYGLVGGPEMRGNGIGKTAGSSVAYNAWYWFSEQIRPDFTAGIEYIQCIHAATSSYTPPAPIVQLAQKKPFYHGFYYLSRPDYLLGKQSFVKLFYKIGQGYTLGTAVSEYGGWSGATSQIVSCKLIAQSPPGSLYEVTTNGRYYTPRNGKIRDPFTQMAQFDNTVVIMSKVPSNHLQLSQSIEKIINQWKNDWERDFLKRFPQAVDYKNVVNKITPLAGLSGVYIAGLPKISWQLMGNMAFARLHTTYIAVRTLSGKSIRFESSLGAGAKNKVENKDHIDTVLIDDAGFDKLSGFIMVVGTEADFSSFDVFRQKSADAFARVQISGDTVNFKTLQGDLMHVAYNAIGTFEEALVDWGYGPTVPQATILSPPFKQPSWPKGKGHGKQPHFSVNGFEVLKHDKWPLYAGPYIQFDNQVLVIHGIDKSTYTIDYSGSLPKWEY